MEMNGTTNGGPRGGVITSLGLLLFGLVVGGALAEVTTRVFARASSSELAGRLRIDPNEVHVEPHGDLGYRQRPNRTFRYRNDTFATSNAMGFRGPEVPVAKPAGTIRVLLLGGSTTHGWGVPDDQTIDHFMRERLASRYPGSAFDVVNLAFDGYDSYQLFERLRSDGLRLDPDFVIVNAGVNDVRNARYPDLQDRDPRTIIWLSEMIRLREEARTGTSLWTRTKRYLYLSRLPGAVRSQLSQAPDTLRTPYPDAIDNFERNLIRIVELARGAGAVVLLSTEPSSLLTKYQPGDTSEISYWIGDAATTQAYRDSLDGRLQHVVDRRGYDDRSVVRVPYVRIAPELFLDDAHLGPEGNSQMADALIEALDPFISAAMGGDLAHTSPHR
jgi:lysophospholipase L1-like esterase